MLIMKSESDVLVQMHLGKSSHRDHTTSQDLISGWVMVNQIGMTALKTSPSAKNNFEFPSCSKNLVQTSSIR